jgi:protein TonB
VSEPWSPLSEPERPRYRPPIGIPVPKRSRLPSTVLSVALHALVIFLIITPFVVSEMRLEEVEGAGGEGPAGGGGGGRRGTGLGVVERLHYMQVAPAPPAPAPTPTPVPKPTPPVVPPPVVPPKQEQPQPQPQPTPTPVTPTPTPQTAASASVATGAEGTAGTGSDGSNGSGPGSGGGVGSGVGTGRGSGVGPGTGGGTASIYPPTPTELFIPPLPVPDKVKGTQLVAVFEVDSTGKVLTFDFTPTRDGGYNRKLKSVLEGIRFRPATRGDGTPVRAQGSVTYIF